MEEEIKNEKFKITRIYDEFPRMISIEMIGSTHESLLYLYESPFGNCQTFTIGSAYKLSYFNQKDIIELFKTVYEFFGRHQLIIDVKTEYNEEVIARINHVIKKRYTKKYKSTNKSIMHLNLIQLDTKKLENN